MAFLMPRQVNVNAKETKAPMFLPQLPQADGQSLLWGTLKT